VQTSSKFQSSELAIWC